MRGTAVRALGGPYAQGLVMCLPFNDFGGQLCIDHAWPFSIGVFNNAPDYTNRWPMDGLNLDNSSPDYISIANGNLHPDFPGKVAPTTPRGMTCLIGYICDDFATAGHSHNILVKGSNLFYLYLNNSDDLQHAFITNGVTGGTTLAAGQYYVGGSRWNGTDVQLFLDGRKDGSSVALATFPTDAGSLRIGTRADLATNRSFDGKVFWVYLWNRPLSDEEILAVSLNPWLVFADHVRFPGFKVAAGGGGGPASGLRTLALTGVGI